MLVGETSVGWGRPGTGWKGKIVGKERRRASQVRERSTMHYGLSNGNREFQNL